MFLHCLLTPSVSLLMQSVALFLFYKIYHSNNNASTRPFLEEEKNKKEEEKKKGVWVISNRNRNTCRGSNPVLAIYMDALSAAWQPSSRCGAVGVSDIYIHSLINFHEGWTTAESTPLCVAITRVYSCTSSDSTYQDHAVTPGQAISNLFPQTAAARAHSVDILMIC